MAPDPLPDWPSDCDSWRAAGAGAGQVASDRINVARVDGDGADDGGFHIASRPRSALCYERRVKIALLVAMCSMGLLFIAHQVRLMLRDTRGRTRELPPTAADAAGAAGGGPLVIGGTGWGGLFVEAGPDDLLLVVLPLLEPLAPGALRDAGSLGSKVRGLIVINDPAVGGCLDTTAIREALGFAPDQIRATAPDPIDRLHGVGRVRKATLLPDDSEVGELEVQRLAPNAILVHHEARGHDLLVGVALTEAQLAAHSISRVVGSLAEPAATKAIVEPNLARVVQASAQGFLLFDGTPPGTTDDVVQVLRTIGIGATVVSREPAWVPLAAQAIAAVRANDATALAALLAEQPADWVALAMTSLVAEGDEDTARQLGDAALARGPDARVHHQLAVLASLRGDDAEAERHLRLAIEGDHAPSLINLAATLAMRDDAAARTEAIELADRAAAAMPDDPLARRTPVLARAYAGQLEAARERLAQLALEPREQAHLEQQLAALGRSERPRQRATFPMHAELAAKAGAQLMDEERWRDAIRMLERACLLDPLRVEFVADLGVALSNAGREPDALALYDRAIDELPEGNLLRLNRGNARRRSGDVDGAIADYRFLVEHAPTLVQPRAALAACLAASGRTAAAEAEVQALAKHGAPVELVEALREEIARTARS